MTKSLFKVRVGVAVFDAQNRLLLARQNHRPFWVLPGGTLEEGETMAECAVREIKEEANLDIRLGPMLYIWDFIAPDRPQTVDIVFASELLGGTLEKETTQNIDDIGFFTINEVLNMPLMPETIFQALLQSWQNGVWDTGRYLTTTPAVPAPQE